MNADPIRNLLEEKISAREFPSASWIVARGEEVVSRGALGYARLAPDRAEARQGTIYDLASLTKPLVTGLLTGLLIEKGEIRLRDRIGDFLPEFDQQDKRDIEIADLLAHRSGFEAWRPFYLETAGDTRADRLTAIVSRIAELPLEYETRSKKVVYSDLNFILLCAIIEKSLGNDLSLAAEENIFQLLGLRSAFFSPPEDRRDDIAASENGNLYERQTAEAAGFEVSGYDWRTETIVGEVHDGNALYLGGISGHAGLFADASDTLSLARQFLPSTTSVLKPETCGLFCLNLTPGADQARSAAFQLAATEGSSAHSVLPDGAFGHLGFTGTMIWIEPDSEGIFLLLTNRTHGRKPPFADLFGTRREFLARALALIS